MRKTTWLLLALALAACSTAPPKQEAPAWTTTRLTAGHPAKRVKAALAPGYAVVAWEETEGSRIRLYLAERTEGGWSDPTLIAGGGNDTVVDYDLAANARGDAVLAWREGSRVRVRVRRNGAWQNMVQLALADPMRITVAMDAGGTAWVAWRQKVGSYYRILVARDPGGGFRTWTVSPDQTHAQTPDLAALSGEALAVWQARSDIGYAAFRNGAWQPPGAFRGAFSNTNPRVALAANRALLIWEKNDPGGSGLRYARREGDSWSSASRLGPPEAGRPAVAAGEDGFLAAWEQPDLGGRAVVAWFFRGSTWKRGVYLSLPGTMACCPSVALAGERALVAWRQDDPGGKGRLYLAEAGGGGWQLPQDFAEALSPDAGDVAEATPAVGLLEDGAALVAWIQGDDAGVPRVWVAERR